MKLTLAHQTTQQKAIKIIDNKINELLQEDFPGIMIIDPIKEWDENIMRFSFTVENLLLSLDFKGIIIVTDQEVVGESDIPPIVTTFFPEEKIKKEITKEFNKLFNIQ